MRLKRSLGLISAVAVATTLAACGSSDSSSTASDGGSAGATKIGDCDITSKANSISITPVKSGTLTVETTLPAQGWWNGTTPRVDQERLRVLHGRRAGQHGRPVAR